MVQGVGFEPSIQWRCLPRSLFFFAHYLFIRFLDESYIEVGTLNLRQMSKMDKPRLSVTKQAVIGLAALAILLWVVLFVPAWTLNYWQAWIFWLVFVFCILIISGYFLQKDLTLIAGRLKVGAAAEQDHIQQLTQVVISVFFIFISVLTFCSLFSVMHCFCDARPTRVPH